MAKGGFVVPPTDKSNVSEGFVSESFGADTLIRYGKAAQGNAQSVSGTMKSFQRARTNARVGGTNNDIRAMFGMDGAKLCKVVTRTLDEHTWQNGVMVRTNMRPSVTHTTIAPVESLPTGSILRRFAQYNARAEDRGDNPMGILAYCNMIGYVPAADQLTELLECA